MNVLFVHEVDWLKKVVFEIINLAEVLSVRRHNVYAIDYPDTWERSGFRDSLKTKEFPNVSRAVPGSSVTLRRPAFIKIPVLSRVSAACTHYFEIRRTIKEKKIDVIMLYAVPTNGLQTLYLARKAGVPVVFRSIDILHRLVRNPVLSVITRRLEKAVYKRADIILAITPNHARYVIGMGADEKKVKLLPLPIDTNIFHPGADCAEVRGKWGYGEKERIVVFIGTLFEFSGLDRFLRSFPALLKRVPDAKLLIVGDGPQRKKLEGIIKELGLEKQVTITGFQPYNTMPQYISLATVCINTFTDNARNRDIFPGKIIQYIACGKAAVVTPLLGITCLIPDETKGLLYASTPDEMAAKVAELLENDEKRHKLEQAGIDYVKQTHDQQKIGEQLEKELQEAIKNKKGLN